MPSFDVLGTNQGSYDIMKSAIKCKMNKHKVVALTITWCDIEVPISSQDPSFFTMKKVCSSIPWQRRSTIKKLLSICTLDHKSLRKKHETKRKGPRNFSMSTNIMIHGLNTLTKHLVLLGSNELTLAIFPVPKNDNVTKNSWKEKWNMHINFRRIPSLSLHRKCCNDHPSQIAWIIVRLSSRKLDNCQN